MRGVVIQKIVKSLSASELHGLRNSLSFAGNKIRFTSLLEFLLNSTYSEEGAILRLGVSKRTKNFVIAEFGSLLIHFLGGNSPSFPVESSLEIAMRLANEMEIEAVQVLVKPILRTATQREEYAVAIRCLDILKMANVQPPKDAIRYEVATRQLMIFSILNNTLSNVWKARSIGAAKEKNERLTQLRNESLSVYSGNRLGHQSQIVFLRIQAIIDSVLRDTDTWISSQEALVAQLKASKEGLKNPEFEIAKESRILIQMYWQSGAIDKFKEFSVAFEREHLVGKASQFERIILQFPFLFGAAIDSGNRELGIQAYEKFCLYLNEGRFEGKDHFTTWNLYWCSYFLLTANRKGEALKVSLLMKKFPRKGTLKNVGIMSRFLEIVLAIEFEEFDDAMRLLKNIKRSAKSIDLGGLPEGISILKDMISAFELKESLLFLQKDEIWASIRDTEFSKYFELEVWFLAKIRGCSMLDEVKHRATDHSLASFTLNPV